MTIMEFEALNRYDQEEAIWWKGNLLAERNENGKIYLLYSLSSFYVELVMLENEEDDMLLIRPFVSTAFLDPYLKIINVNR